MQIGVTRPNHRGIDDVDAVVAIGSLAEEMQFDSCGSVDGAMPFLAADRLKRYQEVGVSHVIFSLETANLDRIRKTMDHIAFRVRPAVE
jgi:hypothetical protein